jgi:protein-S-isoprenylcysteine O-methyltransferase Ste14
MSETWRMDPDRRELKAPVSWIVPLRDPRMKDFGAPRTLACTSDDAPADTVLTTGPSEIIGRALLITLMVAFGWASYGRMVELFGHLSSASVLVTTLTLLSELGAFLFATLVCILAVMRLKPVRTAAGWGPIASALGGTFGLAIVNHLPMPPLPMSLSLLSVILLAIGNAGMVICLYHLGRSFSILPQARQLVSTGPYAHVRHPLYVAEGIATVGMVLLHSGWGAVTVCILQFGLQLVRIHYEEAVLTATFPEYAAYAARTPRFIPRIL